MAIPRHPLRNYRGPDSPSPFMEDIKRMSFQISNILANTGVPIFTMKHKTPNGEVKVHRANNIDYIWTKITGGDIILGEKYDAETIYVFDTKGTFLFAFSPDPVGGMGPNPTDITNIYLGVDYGTSSNVEYDRKYTWAGKVVSATTYSDSDNISGVLHHGIYRAVSRWDNGSSYYNDDGNTQHLELYSGSNFVGELTFNCEGTAGSGHRTYADFRLTDKGMYLLVLDYDNNSTAADKYGSYFQHYDYGLNLLQQTPKSSNETDIATIGAGKNSYIVKGWQLLNSLDFVAFNGTLGTACTFPITYFQTHSVVRSEVGVIKNHFYLAALTFNYGTMLFDDTATIIVYNLNTGAQVDSFEITVADAHIANFQTGEDVQIPGY